MKGCRAVAVMPSGLHHGCMALQTTRAARETLQLGILRLYREELEIIARIVEDESDDLHIEFHDDRGRVGGASGVFDEYQLQPSTEENLERLTITGTRGGTKLTVAFTPVDAELTLTDPDNSARGAANQIRNLCRKNRRMASRVYMNMPVVRYIMAGMGFVATLILGVHLKGEGLVLPLTEGVFLDATLSMPIVVALASMGFLAFILLSLSRQPLLINAPRSERPSWLKRHGKDACLLFVGGCVGYGVNQIPEAVNLLGG